MSRLTEPAWQLGAFAFEADFIDSQQLGQAVLSWSSNPDRPLIEILVEQKSLRLQDLELLQAMWHKQESQAGRATVPHPLDPTLDSADWKGAAGDDDRISDSRPVRTDRRNGDRFQIESCHARGGLGEVFIARDSQLGRKVALKELQPRLLNDPVSCQRFHLEAEITGSLEHPAIVPVYGAGFRDNGAPYYAMRFIAGKTLREVVDDFHSTIAERDRFDGVEFRRLLGRFVDVCRAIGFAHSRQVIHRDIKPANVILGDHGETMVVDWGLAKRLDQPADQETIGHDSSLPDGNGDGDEISLTVEGTTLGTPAFMSPEQAGGKMDELGPTSDVFSLGATLYFLLTGSPPIFGKSQTEAVAMAVQGSYPAPRSLRPTLPTPLDRICVKAMARSASDRYPAAEALAEDIERWLADEPVSVLAESWSQRVGRFARRNRRLTQVIAASVALLAIVATVFSVLLDGQTRIAVREKQSAMLLAKEKSELADRERAARAIANEQGQLALDTIRSVVLDVQRKLQPIPAAHDVRRSLLQTALQGLAGVAASLENQTEVDRSTMMAHNEMGMICLLAGDVLGSDATTTALTHFQLARDIAGQLLADNPEQITLAQDLSIAAEHIGDTQIELGNLDAADEAYDEALQVSLDMAERHPGEVSVLRDVGFGWSKIGDVRLNRGDAAEAEVAIANSMSAFQSMLALDPGNLLFQRDVTVATQKLGNVQLLNSRFAAAADSYRQCLEMLQDQIDAGSKHVQPRDRSVCYNKLGLVLQKLDQPDQSRQAFEAGLEIAESIAATTPDSVQARRDLSISLSHVASVKMELGELEAAGDLLARSLQIRTQLAGADEQNFVAQASLAHVFYQTGKLDALGGQAENSRRHFREALDILQSLDPASINESVEYRTLLEEVQAALAGGQ